MGLLLNASSALLSLCRDGTLQQFLENVANVHQDAVLAYLSDGRRLTNENIRDLAGAQDDVSLILMPLEKELIAS